MQIEDDEGVDVAAVEPAVAAEVEEEDVHVGGEDEPEDNDDEGYDSFIEERSRPATPQPDPAVERDADGWNLIAKLGPTASFLSSFPALQEVPCQHEQTWVEAFSKVLLLGGRPLPRLRSSLPSLGCYFCLKPCSEDQAEGGEQAGKRWQEDLTP